MRVLRRRKSGNVTGSDEQEPFADLGVVLDRLLLIVAPEFAPQRSVAQLPLGLEWRHWAAGSFGQAWPEVWLFIIPTLTMLGPAEHVDKVVLLSVCHCIISVASSV